MVREESDDSFADDVQISVKDNAITVSLPGTSFSVTYRKLPDKPWLTAADIADVRGASTSQRFGFRARAWTAANDKARELGWIV